MSHILGQEIRKDKLPLHQSVTGFESSSRSGLATFRREYGNYHWPLTDAVARSPHSVPVEHAQVQREQEQDETP